MCRVHQVVNSSDYECYLSRVKLSTAYKTVTRHSTRDLYHVHGVMPTPSTNIIDRKQVSILIAGRCGDAGTETIGQYLSGLPIWRMS